MKVPQKKIKDDIAVAMINRKKFPSISDSMSSAPKGTKPQSTRNKSLHLRLESLSASDDETEQEKDKAERTRRFKILSNVIKSHEMSKIFRKVELT
jgi:hypothetical protein